MTFGLNDQKLENIYFYFDSKSLAQTFINIGSKYGSINVEDVVPTPKTVSNRLTKTYDMIKLKVINTTKKSAGLGLTLDLWKHDISGAHYITITAHYSLTRL